MDWASRQTESCKFPRGHREETTQQVFLTGQRPDMGGEAALSTKGDRDSDSDSGGGVATSQWPVDVSGPKMGAQRNVRAFVLPSEGFRGRLPRQEAGRDVV